MDWSYRHSKDSLGVRFLRNRCVRVECKTAATSQNSPNPKSLRDTCTTTGTKTITTTKTHYYILKQIPLSSAITLQSQLHRRLQNLPITPTRTAQNRNQHTVRNPIHRAHAPIQHAPRVRPKPRDPISQIPTHNRLPIPQRRHLTIRNPMVQIRRAIRLRQPHPHQAADAHDLDYLAADAVPAQRAVAVVSLVQHEPGCVAAYSWGGEMGCGHVLGVDWVVVRC